MTTLRTVHKPAVSDELTRLSLLYEVSRLFSELVTLDLLIPAVIAKTNDLLEAESTAILLLDEASNELYFPYVADVTPDVERRLSSVRFPADRGIAGWVVQNNRAQLVTDVSQDKRWYAQVDCESGMVTTSILCAPLRTSRGTIGVIELRNKVTGDFSAGDLHLLDALAGVVAVAIENARLYQQIKESEAQLRVEVGVLHREIAGHSRFANIVGSSPVMQQLFRLMESAINNPVTVLLQGETGTGKELIARTIHYNGPRSLRPFQTVNCGALTETLLESELFGHKRGAFTGAVADRKGLFEVANGGTLFLDEIGEMSPAMQVKLLRVLQNGEILPVGDTTARFVDVRIISATNRDLEIETSQRRFRRDLYYRLCVFPISAPPLRTHKEDIPLLATHCLAQITERFSKPVCGFAPPALELLAAYDWPGNVRELQNEIERAVVLVAPGEWIHVEHLSPRLLSTKTAKRLSSRGKLVTLKRAREQFEEAYIGEVLQHNKGNASQAAQVLGISRVMIQKKIKTYGLRAKLAATS